MITESLTIKNFRLLEDIEIKTLGHVNLIVGKNNSGKSTLLEALAFLSCGFNAKRMNQLLPERKYNQSIKVDNWYEISIPFRSLISKETTNSDNWKRTTFIGSTSDFYIEFGLSDYYEKFKFIECKYIEQIKQLYSNYTIASNLGVDYKENIPLEESENSIFHSCEFVDTHKLNLEDLSQNWDDILLTEFQDLTVKMLQFIEPNIIDFAFITQNGTRKPFVRFENKEDRVAIDEMGDGIFRLLQIILKAVKCSDGYLLIDELENGLHYSIQPKVWDLIFELSERFNIQVFATTHSWDCIESFAHVAKQRDETVGKLIRMGRSARKSDEGKVIATVYDEDELYNITKTKMEVR